jgi:hypothetical protein
MTGHVLTCVAWAFVCWRLSPLLLVAWWGLCKTTRAIDRAVRHRRLDREYRQLTDAYDFSRERWEAAEEAEWIAGTRRIGNFRFDERDVPDRADVEGDHG